MPSRPRFEEEKESVNKTSGHKVTAVQVMAGDLAIFIDRLAEDVVLSDDISACAMCAIGKCEQQVSGLVCRNAVKAWLLSKAGEYLPIGQEKS